MNEDWITALAREYAEELCPDNKVEREMIELDCLGFLDRVLNSYCLVEKSKLRKQYAKCMQQFCSTRDVAAKEYAAGRLNALEFLFPEIAKEVEG